MWASTFFRNSRFRTMGLCNENSESMCFSRLVSRFDTSMKKSLIAMLFAVAAWAPEHPARAEILDRVMAVVTRASGRTVITLSDVHKEREIQKALDRDLATDQDVLQFLIERYLVEDQMQFSGVDASDQEIDERMADIRDLRGIARSDLRDALAREIRAEKYYESRFGQFIRPSDEELRDYYENVLLPEARSKGLTIPSFEQAMQSSETATQLRTRVILEKRKREVATWLENIK